MTSRSRKKKTVEPSQPVLSSFFMKTSTNDVKTSVQKRGVVEVIDLIEEGTTNNSSEVLNIYHCLCLKLRSQS